MQSLQQPQYLPMTRKELDALGWRELDCLLICGDAYVDHPSFGLVLLGRWLIHHGFRTGLICQPNWRTCDDLLVMGSPRLFVGIGAGCVDSMVAHYSAFRKKREKDAYSPGGRMGARPNRATIVYTNLAKQAFPSLPIILGGIEASTRRLTHYDFWTDSLRRPLLFDAKADLLVFGMGESQIVEVAKRLSKAKVFGKDTDTLIGIPGTAWISPLGENGPTRIPASYRDRKCCVFPSHEECLAKKNALMKLACACERRVHSTQMWGYQVCGDRALVLAEPAKPLTQEAMDTLYGLPFTRKKHPSYTEEIPAQTMLSTSITSHRGCGGGCSFCSLAMHQGRRISSRSQKSILNEVKTLVATTHAGRRSHGLAISDIGGPTANMWQASCTKKPKNDSDICLRSSCCYPKICPYFATKQKEHIALLQSAATVPGVSSVRVASGIRPDIALCDRDSLITYIRNFTGGQLKIAPEHVAANVLALMRKPDIALFEEFLALFQKESRVARKEQYIVPYLMSAFPGCTDSDMELLRDWLKSRNWSPKQTQCFIPTPGTVATAMFYCEENERGEPIYVAKTDAARLRQHALLCGNVRDCETIRKKHERRRTHN